MTAPAATRVRSPDADRARLALLVRIAAAGGQFSPSLADAVHSCTDVEVRVMTDLVDRGMTIPELVSVLQGAHVIVGDDALYRSWIFPASRRRISSHHRDIDKRATPDYAIAGPLVRESLHGKAWSGTWVQLERSRATFVWGRLPTWSDVEHLRDYAIYRLTGLNVGPWGLSALVDTRPMFIRPTNTTSSRFARRGLTTYARRMATFRLDTDARAQVTDVLTPDVAPVGPAGEFFGPPDPPDPVLLLPGAPFTDELGEGLFGSLPLTDATTPLPPAVVALLDAPPPPPEDSAAAAVRFEAVELPLGGEVLTLGAAVLVSTTRPLFIGIEEEPR